MKTFVFKRKDYETYQDFYRDIAKKTDAKSDIEMHYPEDFNCEPDWLWEHLWMFYNEEIKIVLIGFDKEKIKMKNNIFDLEASYILSCFEDLVNDFPNKIVEYRDDDEEK